MDVNELRRQHQELTVIAGQLLQAVADEATPQSVGALRWRLARALMSHLALEDRIFYPAMLRISDDRARATAMQLQAELGMLAHSFSAYMHRWNDDQVVRNWAEFCTETRAMLGALKSRMEQEERQLYPLAEDALAQEMLQQAG